MLESKVTVVIPFKCNLGWLDLSTQMWLAQEPQKDITIHILDTENILFQFCNHPTSSWILNHPRIEVAHLGMLSGKHHPSDPVAIAYDFAFSRALSEWVLTTHVDVFPKHRHVVAYMLEQTRESGVAGNYHESRSVVGWEMSKRGLAAQMLSYFIDQGISPLPKVIEDAYDAMPSPSDGTIGMVCSLFNVKAMDIAGLTWSLRRCHHAFGTSRGPTDFYGHPDTETISKYIFEKAGIIPKFLGRESNFENQETDHWIHARSMTLKVLPRHIEAFNKAKEIYDSWQIQDL